MINFNGAIDVSLYFLTTCTGINLFKSNVYINLRKVELGMKLIVEIHFNS